MIDALLFAVRDGLRAAGFGYGVAQTDIMDDGQPPANCGNVFVSIYQGNTTSTNDNCLMEYFDWNLCLTMRVSVPLNRVGDSLLAAKLARKSGPGNPSFNARMEQLRAWGHMNWPITVLPGRNPPSANDNLIAWCPSDTASVYGFIEPARYKGADKAVLVGPDWFTAVPEAHDTGLKAELRFAGARRMQPQLAAVGPFI